jgi:hypothetical protein
VTYTTQTFEQHRGFSFPRFVAGLFVAALIAVSATGVVLLTPLANAARALTFRTAVVDRGTVVTLAPGATASVTLRFRNAGLAPWERGASGTQVNLGVKGDSLEFAKGGMAVGWLSDTRIATTIESVVPAGAVGTFTFSVRAPGTVGVYQIPVNLVVDGVTWLNDENVVVTIASNLGFHSELLDQSRHPTLRPGETSGPITVKLRNVGSRTWVRGAVGQQVNLGIVGEDRRLSPFGVGWPSADRVAIQSEANVGPGDAATFTFRLVAPTTPATYALRLRPVVDGVTWLESSVVSLITVSSASQQQSQQATVSFTASASVSPASVSAGEPATITATFTSSSDAPALLGVEVYAPGGAVMVFQQWIEGQVFVAGKQRAYPVTWKVPANAAPGEYTVSLRAFAAGWKTPYGSRDTAATFAVAAPGAIAQPARPTSPTTNMSASPSASAPGAGTTSDPRATPTAPPTSSVGPTSTPGPTASQPAATPAPTTSAPTASPTTEPTASPTTAPTASPTPTASPVPTATPTPAPIPTPAPTSATGLLGLRAQGNRLVDTSGATVILHGVNNAGPAYACIQGWGIFEGPSNAASVLAIKSWRTNSVRVPLNEDCWLAINGVLPQYSGATYRQAIVNYVNLLNQNGLYAILDLHWSAPGTTRATGQEPMPNRDHSVDFWSSVAATFTGNERVIFEPFNEPWPDGNRDSVAAWTCWRDGCVVPAGNNNQRIPYPAYQAAGMQEIVTAIRATGATNLIALGGVQWSTSLSRWLAYKPSDPLNNLAAAWHIYNFNGCNDTACWQSHAGVVTAQVPLIATEIGVNNCDAVHLNAVMSFLESHSASYLGWTWNTWGASCSSISLITSYTTGAPTVYGLIFKTRLAALP